MLRQLVAHCSPCLVVLGMLSSPGVIGAQTADDVTKLIDRLVELDSIDLCKFDVKFSTRLDPSFAAADADESGMTVLKNPHEMQGRGSMGCWYRVSFVVPDKIGKLTARDAKKYGEGSGIESNIQGGSWELYSYCNGKPEGTGRDTPKGLLKMNKQAPTAWISNAPMVVNRGDTVTVAILAYSDPLGRGSPEGFSLRHLRLRVAGGHSSARTPFFQELSSVRAKLETLKGDELKALQEKVKEPLARVEALFGAAESGDWRTLSNAMRAAQKELSEGQKK